MMGTFTSRWHSSQHISGHHKVTAQSLHCGRTGARTMRVRLRGASCRKKANSIGSSMRPMCRRYSHIRNIIGIPKETTVRECLFPYCRKKCARRKKALKKNMAVTRYANKTFLRRSSGATSRRSSVLVLLDSTVSKSKDVEMHWVSYLPVGIVSGSAGRNQFSVQVSDRTPTLYRTFACQ